jgi:hypothetical protein
MAQGLSIAMRRGSEDKGLSTPFFEWLRVKGDQPPRIVNAELRGLHFTIDIYNKKITRTKENIMANIETEVVVTDIKMPFGSMVLFMVKLAIATIPAVIILSVVGSITFGLINVLLGGPHIRMHWF